MPLEGTTINIDAQDTAFSRDGQTTQVVTREPASFLHNNLSTGYIQLRSISAPDHSPETPTTVPFSTIYRRVFSSYAADTEALYEYAFELAVAHSQSGPVNVRGGTARQGFETALVTSQMSINRFKELWQAEQAFDALVIQATTAYNAANNDATRLEQSNSELQVMAQHANAQSLLGVAGVEQSLNHNRIQAYAMEYQYGTTQMFTSEGVFGKGIQGTAAQALMTSWK